MHAMQLCEQDYRRIWPADLEEVMCKAQAAATGPTITRMSDVSGIWAAPLCPTMQHNTELHTVVGSSLNGAEAQAVIKFLKRPKIEKRQR